MRLVTYRRDGDRRLGAVVDGAVVDVPDTVGKPGYPETMEALVEEGTGALDAARTALAGPEVDRHVVPAATLLVPILPASLRDFLAFEDHVKAGAARRGEDVNPAWYEMPIYYKGNHRSVYGPDEEIPWPPYTEELDYELEVAAVVGARGRDLDEDTAARLIFGYTLMNDWSARDIQRKEMAVRLGPAKGKDFATSLGPCLVTADELAPFRDEEGFLALGLTAMVNGEEVGRDLLSNMGWPFRDLVAYASRGTWVRAGDVLGSGTCGNGGCLAELWGRRGRQDPPPLRAGDLVALHVEGIGTLSNTVVEGRPAPSIPAARPRPRERP
jgi:2-keto-4-pentenoate hydratase/2-oxohepta-3-ene-1,7-dioic acid hydratase in catechol pathway